ncbi:ATP-dependent helicase [[Acholeplasma] multilocale]|uniref:ATP-dependent helicase n=1 Tax=[Acholeplasma] multilocale TaxID=264638 RepID=UPI0004797A07|nr:UvrD-helicase domain-containing protein [[Acholeplasma] multilocale]
MSNLLEGLNPQQLKAVTTTKQPLRIIAGAGSGKTKVITTKIAYLIQEEKIAPWKILAMTFTNKAAREMKERVEKITGQMDAKPFISTFHAWCSRVLREEFTLVGLQKGFLILDQSDQRSFIKKIVKELDLATEENKRKIEKQIMNRISNWKNMFMTPEDAASDAYSLDERNAVRVYKIYEQRLNEANSVDFNDLQMKVHQLFNQNPEVVEKWRNRYDYVMVDEFQDTNDVQFDLIKFLTKGKTNLTVVGDPDQTIYSWRGARVNIIMNFHEAYKDAVSIVLNENYRSTQQILDLANDFIDHNKNREKKNIYTNNPSGKKVEMKECSTRYAEAKFVANEIKDLVKQGYSYGDVFVLYRMNAWSQEFEKVFDNSKIPFQLIGGLKFRERKVVKDSMALIKSVSVKDDLSMERVLGFTPKIGAVTIQKIIAMADEMELSIFDLITHPNEGFINSVTKNLSQLREVLINAEEIYHANNSIEDLLKYMLVNSGYEERLKVLDDEDDIQNIRSLYDQLNNFDQSFDPEFYNEENRVIAFLQEESLSSEEDDNAEPNKVTLLTIHSAKGLENKIVFVVGLNRDVFPGRLSMHSTTELEEERRALYVALTRAEQRLYISYVRGEYSYISQGELAPSKFITELNNDLYNFEQGLFVHADGVITSNKATPTSYPSSRVAMPDVMETDIKVGDRVNHIVFGDGVVIKIISRQFQIAFNNASYGVMMIAIDNPTLSKK